MPRIAAALLTLALAAVAHGSEPLGLQEALAIAEQQAPMLAARQAAERAASALVGPAGELPDPVLVTAIENLPVTGAEAGSLTDDFMTMRRVGLMQEFPRRSKREMRTERALAEVERERSLFEVEAISVREDVAKAWIATWASERRLALLDALEPRLGAQVLAADAGIAAGRGSTADAIVARMQRRDLEDRRAEGGRDVLRARAELARWLGSDAQRPLADPPDFRTLPRDPEAIVAAVGQHRGLLAFAARERAAQAELALARAEKRPDWALEVSYAERGPAYSDMVSVGVRIGLPIFQGRRQDPVVASKAAAVEQVEAEHEAARREHLAELHAALAIFDAARERLARSERELLPLAQDRADAAAAAYRGGGGDLAGSLGALADLVERQLEAADRLADLGEAWASLRYAFAKEP